MREILGKDSKLLLQKEEEIIYLFGHSHFLSEKLYTLWIFNRPFMQYIMLLLFQFFIGMSYERDSRELIILSPDLRVLVFTLSLIHI